MKISLFKIILRLIPAVLIIAICAGQLLDYRPINASLISRSPEIVKIAALNTFTGASISEKTTGQYEISYPGTGSKVLIGNTDKSATFKPDLTISKWNGEAEFRLISPVSINEKSQLTSVLSADRVTATSGQWIFEYKPTEPIKDFNDQGGFDLIITAKDRPASNRIEFTYDSANVTAYWQPELTEDELKDGCERPIHVVNSIAFYATDKANYEVGKINYGTGKIGHLYRMIVEGYKDAYCDWTVDKDLIVLTVPKDIIDNSHYPLRLIPFGDTFGYTGTPVTTSSRSDRTYCHRFTSPSGFGTVTSMSVYAKGNAVNKAYFGIYGDTSNLPATRLAYENIGIALPASVNWASQSISYSGSEATLYWLCYRFPSSTTVYYDSTAAASVYKTSGSSWSDPMGSTSGFEVRFGIYATYTAGGGAPAFIPKIIWLGWQRLSEVFIWKN